jgi:hypothetical protein
MLIWIDDALPTAFFSLRQNKKEFYSLLAFCSRLAVAKMKSQHNPIIKTTPKRSFF